MTFSIPLDLWPLTAAVLAAVGCGLLGNFLVLRRESLMGDAISHAVLPGLVLAFLLSGSRSPWLMLGGAAAAGAVCVLLIAAVRQVGRVESGAAMGVVFSVMFALGVLLIEQSAARQVDLDADCVLYGQLETLSDFSLPATWMELVEAVSAEGVWAWSGAWVPRQVWLLLGVAMAAGLFTGACFKELRLASFDPALASSQGVPAGALHLVHLLLVAAATVAAFEAVGSILVIAMLICPAAAARLLTDRLTVQVVLSLLLALVTAVGGYVAATAVPGWFGVNAVNAAGAMTVVAGALIFLAAVFAPGHGLLAASRRRRRLASRTAVEDLLLALYRAREAGREPEVLRGLDPAAVRRAARRGWVLSRPDADAVRLTAVGEAEAAELLRRHRRWEGYLVEDAGYRPDHVHATAEVLEHAPVRPPESRSDPHGRVMP